MKASVWHAECLYPITTNELSFRTTNRETRKDSVRMANELRTEVEQVKKQEDVKRALKQASPIEQKDQPKAEARDKLVLTSHVIVLLGLGALRYLLQFSLFGFAAQHPRLIDMS